MLFYGEIITWYILYVNGFSAIGIYSGYAIVNVDKVINDYRCRSISELLKFWHI